MPATLTTRDLAVAAGPRPLLGGRRPRPSRPGARVGLVGPNGVGQVHAAAGPRRPAPPDGGRVDARPADRHRRLPPPGARAPAGRDRAPPAWPAAPGWPRRRPTSTPPPRPSARTPPGPTDAYTGALDRWSALGGADFDARAGRRARRPRPARARARPADGRRCRAARRPGRSSPRCSWPASTCSSSTSPPTTSTSTASTGWSASCSGWTAALVVVSPRPGLPRAHRHGGGRASTPTPTR